MMKKEAAVYNSFEEVKFYSPFNRFLIWPIRLRSMMEYFFSLQFLH